MASLLTSHSLARPPRLASPRPLRSTPARLAQYQSELTRMLTLKRSNLSSFILRERTLLTSLWDTLFLSPSERIASFPLFEIDVAPRPCEGGEQQQEDGEEMAMEVNENVSEELLLAHERERERVERLVEEGREVLSRVGRYFACVEEGRELEVSLWFGSWPPSVTRV